VGARGDRQLADDELHDSVRRAHQRIDELGDDLRKLMLSSGTRRDRPSSIVPAFPWKWLIVAISVIVLLVLGTAGLINWELVEDTFGWVDHATRVH